VVYENGTKPGAGWEYQEAMEYLAVGKHWSRGLVSRQESPWARAKYAEVVNGSVCDQKTSKFFVSHQEESMAGP
jgi:hypothetical protein